MARGRQMKDFKIDDIVNINSGEVAVPQLEGKDGEIINTEDFFKGIISHIEEEMDNDTSYLYTKVYPLLTYGLIPILDKIFNQPNSIKIMSDPTVRHLLTYCIITGFVSLKAIQSGEYQIKVGKKQISQETLDLVNKQKEILRIIDEYQDAGMSTEEIAQKISSMDIFKKKPQDN